MGSHPEWLAWLQSLEDRLSRQMISNVLDAIRQRQWSEAQTMQFFMDARRFGDDFFLNALHNLVHSTPLAQPERSRQQRDEEGTDEGSVDLELRLGRSGCRSKPSSRLRATTSHGEDPASLNLGLGTTDDSERHHDSDFLVWFGA